MKGTPVGIVSGETVQRKRQSAQGETALPTPTLAPDRLPVQPIGPDGGPTQTIVPPSCATCQEPVVTEPLECSYCKAVFHSGFDGCDHTVVLPRYRYPVCPQFANDNEFVPVSRLWLTLTVSVLNEGASSIYESFGLYGERIARPLERAAADIEDLLASK